MAQGKITYINHEKGFGKITPDGGGDLVYFRLDWVKNTPPGGMQQGMRMQFESEVTDKGPRARSVRLIPSVTSQGEAQKTGAELQQSGYKFLNPYNFVRFLRQPRVFHDQPDTQLMGRCSPPPHDRWVGLSGVIKCQAEAVTPLFISDSQSFFASEEDKRLDHHSYFFYKYDFGKGPEPAIPASSLRGMLRNVFEAATNSCYAHFNYDKRLSYHLAAAEALKLTPGRVEKDIEGRLWLRLLPGTATLAVGERPRDKLYAARVERYRALKPVRRRSDVPPKQPNIVELDGLQHKDACVALVEELNFPPVCNVLKLVAHDKRKDLPSPVTAKHQKIIEGYLCVTNQNIETKRFERLFFRDKNASGVERILLTDETRKKYAELIKDYQERHADEVKRLKEKGRDPSKVQKEGDKQAPAFSYFVIGGPCELQHGDLVYTMLSGTPFSPNVEFLVPVAVPRVGYKRKVDELLPEHLWKCEEYEALCPACRTFGWVYGTDRRLITELPEEKRKEKLVAYAGRLSFSHGKLNGEGKVEHMPPVTLAVLGSPKPTTTRFYLRPSDGKPKDRQDDFQAGYDNRFNVLRGRKVYRHHGHAGDTRYWNEASREYRSRVKKSEQNRTICDALQPGAIFTFTVHFENLAAVELGALLWSLNLGGQGYHRLGYAKPLGFGSLNISVTELKYDDPVQRYGSKWQNGECTAEPEKIASWINCFQEAMRLCYEQPFQEQPHIKELRALLDEPKQDIPIHYPRSDVELPEEGKNFEWFMGNSRNKEARFALKFAGDDESLLLIDKAGNVKR
jgi:CRISPR-associated protein (TIGR03986 family)